MRFFSLATVFCSVWVAKVTDGSPAQNSYLKFINSDTKHIRYFLTSRNVRSSTTERLDAYTHPKVQFMMWDDNSKLAYNKYKLKDKRLHYTRTRVDNSQPSLISSRKSKQWDQLNVAVKRNPFLTFKLLDSIKGTNHVPYHRGRRNTNSRRSNGNVAVPNVNLASLQLGTTPGDIHTNDDAPSNIGLQVSDRDGNVHISETVDLNTNGNLVTGTPLTGQLSGQVHPRANASMRESSNPDGINLDNAHVNSEARGSDHQEPSSRGGASGSEPGNTPEENSRSVVLDHPLVVVEPAGGVVSVNFSEGREHANTDVGSASVNIHTSTYPASNASNEELSSTDSNEGSRTATRDITSSAINILRTQDNTAPCTSLHSASPSTSRPKSNEIGVESTINEQLQTSLPRRITAPTRGPSSPSETTRVFVPQLQNSDLTRTTPHVHFVAESPSSTGTPPPSRPLPSVASLNGRASSRDTPIVVIIDHTNTSALLVHPTGHPPPIINRPDSPELVHPVTTEAQITESIQRHPNTEGNDIEGKTTETPSTTAQETSDHRRSRGTSSYATTDTTLKSTSTGNTTNNETDSPTSYMELKLGMSWRYFCQQETAIRQELVDILHVHVNSVGLDADQIQVMDRETVNCYQGQASDVVEILVRMYLTNNTHQFDRNLTLQCATILKAGIPFNGRKSAIIKTRLLDVYVHDKDGGPGVQTTSDDHLEDRDSMSSDTSTDHRVTIAIALAVVGGCCCIALIILQVFVRRRNKDSSPIPSISSSYNHGSSDSIQLASVIKSRPNSGLVNPGLDILEPVMSLLEPPWPSHPLNYIQLSNFCVDENKIAEEYEKLPQRMPRPSMVPAGEEDKNRYANILPLVHTRVKLTQDGPGRRSSYINANYVTGPNNQCQYYIATQAPTENTTTDFWTMIWQQGCQTIVMLTGMEEQGQIKCASYWPELVGKSAAHKHGDFLIELIQKDVHQEYIVSRLEINNQRKIETRQIDHFWYTCWPPHGLPEPISLVKLVLDVRPKYENGTSPLVVHCSPGTGRTCTFIALDLCMKQLETKRMVDVMKTVNSIRQERAGAIQNKEQYAFLYSAVHEYAAIITTPGIDVTSSAATLQALLSK